MDNISLFNRLTHDSHGLVKCELFNKLLVNFDDYTLLKAVTDGLEMENINSADYNDDRIIFPIKFKTKRQLNCFIEKLPKKITYKNNTHNVLFNIDGKEVNIYFEK